MARALSFLASLLLAGAALAQGYPNRAVKVIVPWPPGQATDIAARVVAEKLQVALGQPFVVENRPGAGGSIGTDVVAKSAPDGYTVLAASAGPISIMPHLQKTPYDPLKDFAPVSLIALVPFVLVTHPSFPASDMPDVPTIAEAAPLPGYDIGAWIGYTAPAGTPREAVARLAVEMQKIARAPDIKERYLTLGLDPLSGTPDEMAAFMRQQQERYGSIIKSQGIKIE